MGSFLNCLSWRIAHGQSAIKGRSACPKCGHKLGALDLVPLFSWLALKGKCRYCGEKISARYPLTELICGLGYLSLVLKFGLEADTLRYILLFSLLFAASLVDIEDGWIPDRFIVTGGLGWLASLAIAPAEAKEIFKTGIIGALALYIPMLLFVLFFDKLMGRETMGGGDLKLYSLCGLYLGAPQGLLLIILSCIYGLIIAACIGKLKPNTELRFGPSIALAAWTVMIIGAPVLNWYFSLF